MSGSDTALENEVSGQEDGINTLENKSFGKCVVEEGVDYLDLDTVTCVTSNGIPCLFPWTFDDRPTVYDGCAEPDKPDEGSRGLWCPTGLIDGNYIRGSGTWGFCDKDSCNLTGANTMCFKAGHL